MAWAAIVLCSLLCLPTPLAAASVTPAGHRAQAVALSWQALCSPAGYVSLLAGDPAGNTLYAVSVASVNRQPDYTQWLRAGKTYRSDALYGSQDRGATWLPLTNDLPPGPITALYADPVTGALYVGVRANDDPASSRYGLWRSRDRGASWEQVRLEGGGLTVARVARSADGRYLYLAAAQATGERASYLYRSADDGRTWSSFRFPAAAGGTDLIPHPTDADRLLALSAEGAVYLSEDAGETWTPAAAGSQAPASGPARLAFNPDRPDTALLARQEGQSSPPKPALARSTDGGATWSDLRPTGLPAAGTVTALAALPGGVYLLGLSAGTFRSADGGATWQRLEGPLSSSGVTAFVTGSAPAGGASSTGHGPVPVWAATGYGVFVSSDAGALWQAAGSGLPCNSGIAGLITDARQPERVFAITDGRGLDPAIRPPSVLRSADGGHTWTPAARGLPDGPILAWAQDPGDVNALFLVGPEQIMRTTDAGLSWQTSGRPPSAAAAIAIAASDPKTVYVGGRPALRSTDRGATWAEMAVALPGQERQAGEVVGLAVDPADARRLWAAVDGLGVLVSADGGASWQLAGLEGQRLNWLAGGPSGSAGGGSPGRFTLYAGVPEGGIYRWSEEGDAWVPASAGLPGRSTIVAFAADPRTPGTLWAARDGGGVYRSTDFGATWTNAAANIGDNLAQALAPYYGAPGGLLMGTAAAGVWALRPAAPPAEALPSRAEGAANRVDARIEVVWPHDGAPVATARLANIGLRLFQPHSLLPPGCGWAPRVTVWQAADTNPAEPLGTAVQRTVDGQPFPYWELNDVDVSRANDPTRKLYFMVRVAGAETATSIWAHGADPRTYFPSQDVPSGVASGPIDAVDARIQIVWPHDESGAARPVSEATLANVAVALFKHGTRLSVPAGWQPAGLALFGAWDQEVGRPLALEGIVSLRQAGAITYPVWEFNNIPVARAAGAQGATLYLWAMVEGVETYPTLWAHGADARTWFPSQEEPIQGCMPEPLTGAGTRVGVR